MKDLNSLKLYLRLKFIRLGKEKKKGDNYTLPTCDLPLILCAHPWFKF